MGIKRYILLTFVYVLAIGLYVYSFNGNEYTLAAGKFTLSLPIAIWIILPVIILFAGSIAHMLYYSFKSFLQNRGLKKDFENFKIALSRKVLGENNFINYKTEYFKFVGKSLQMLSFKEVPKDFSIDNEMIDASIKFVEEIRAGKVVDIKKYKLAADNELRMKDKFNRLAQDPKYAMTILKECQDMESELCQKAYFEFIKFASYDEIKKIKFPQTKEIFRVLMERYLEEKDDFEMDLDSIENLLTQFKADSQDYLELAREIKVKLDPDAMIVLFEKLYNSTEHVAVDAYLYVLYELQMIDKMREILENSEENEFIKFKTLLFLRDNGRNVNSDLLLGV
jgi:hypothetical protein